MRSDPRLTRRQAALGLGLSPVILGKAGQALAAGTEVVIHSPAPPTHPMHALNTALEAAVRGTVGLPVRTVSEALPESVNRIAAMAADARPWNLPIVTTVDFQLARSGGGPDWHRYDRALADLRFVSTLYDVGFGVFTADPAVRAPEDLRGRRIAVPPRPSSVRLLTELLLGPGWGVLDQVTLVDMPPHAALEALAAGTVDATTWNLILPGASGRRPLSSASARFIPVDDATLARIGQGGGSLGRVTLGVSSSDDGPVISFAQGIAAWADTPAGIVQGLISGIRGAVGGAPGLPATVAAMSAWPGLTAEMRHPAA